MIKNIVTIIITAVFLPQLAQAQLDSTNVSSLVSSAHGLVNRTLIPVLVSLALIYVIYSVVVFIGASEDSQKKEEKKQQIFWGVIGLFVIVSIWGLVALVGRSFGIFAGGTLTIN
jgi:cell division protein FtsW (lipid II flippase)